MYSSVLRVYNNTSESPFIVPVEGEGTDDPLPIQLASFAARVQNGAVVLEWMTLSELNNFGFEIQISPSDSLHYSTLPNSFVPGHGTTNEPQTYSFTVLNPPPIGFYRLKQIDLDGTTWFSDGLRVVVTPVSVDEHPLPEVFAVRQNYPNPFNPATTISFDLPVGGATRVEVFNTPGQVVSVPMDGWLPPGRHSVTIDGSNLPSGLYFYRVQAGGHSAIRGMILMR
jgi:hypothetical protein